MAQSAVFLAYTGSTTPVDDTDGVEGLADVDTTNGAVVTFDILTDGRDIGSSANDPFGIEVAINDTLEIDSLANVSVFGAVALLPNSGTRIWLSWDLVGTAVANTVLASFDVKTNILGFRPDDDAADIVLGGLSGANGNTYLPVSVFDPIADNTVAGFTGYDFQTVPLPASFWMLGGGLMAAGAMARRSRRA